MPACAYPVTPSVYCLTKKGPDPACEQDPEIDTLEDAADEVLVEAEKKDQCRVRNEDRYITIPYFVPVENKPGLVVLCFNCL